MKSHSFLRSALLTAGFVTLGATASFGQAAAAAPAAQGAAAAAGAGRGGGGGGGGGAAGTAGIARPMPARGLQDEEGQQPPVLNDLEVTEITRVKLGAIGTATKVLADARTELTKASFALPANAQNITAKVQALANAEQALASSRADAYANLLKTYKDASPEKKRAVTNALSGTGGGGRGGN